MPIIEIAASHSIDLVKLFPFCGPTADPNHPFNHRDAVRQAIDDVLKRAGTLGVTVELGASPHPDLTLEGALFDRCSHPWTHLYVSHQGGIGFCDHLIGRPEYVLGEWDAEGFHERWNGQLFRRLRLEHAGGAERLSDRFKACRWCYCLRYSDVEHWLRTVELQRRVSTDERSVLYDFPSDAAVPSRLEFP